MVEKFDCIREGPVAFSLPELTLKQHDTIMLEFDPEIWDLDDAKAFINELRKLYPHNKLMALFKGGVIIGGGGVHNVED